MYIPVNAEDAIRKEGLRRRFSFRTIETYRHHVRKFLESTEKTLDKISKKDVREYLENLAEKELSGSTLNVNLQALKFFFGNCLGKRMRIYLKYSRVPVRLPVVLSKEEIKKLFEAIENRKHRFIISFMYSTGLRVSELVNLRVGYLELERGFGWVRHGKGDKDRMIIISEKLKKELANICENRDKNEFLFLTNKKQRYNVNSIYRIIKNASKIARINKNVHPHTLRHSFATHLIENGYSIADVQHLLGHSSPETTMVYLHTATSKMLNIKSPLDNF